MPWSGWWLRLPCCHRAASWCHPASDLKFHHSSLHHCDQPCIVHMDGTKGIRSPDHWLSMTSMTISKPFIESCQTPDFQPSSRSVVTHRHIRGLLTRKSVFPLSVSCTASIGLAASCPRIMGTVAGRMYEPTTYVRG